MVISALLLVLSPALYGHDQAPMPIHSNVATIRDSARDKDLIVRVTYPENAGRYPLLVISHGFRGSENGLLPLTRFWASRGYVTLQPRHPDSMRELKPAERIAALQPRAGQFSAWRERVDDDTFLMSAAALVERAVPGTTGKIDSGRIGQGGHSFGAHTSQLIAGTQLLGRSFADPRPRAILLISPQGVGGGLVDRAWANVKRPLMVITGSEDKPPIGTSQTPEDRKRPYEKSPPGDKYLLWIEGAHHDFGGINEAPYPGSGPSDPKMVSWIQSAGLAFFDAYVKGKPEALKWLKSGEMNPLSGRKARLSSR